jgi:hypothetical protein
MPKVNVNAFGVVNLNFAACAFNRTIINRQYSMAYASFLRICAPPWAGFRFAQLASGVFCFAV